MHLIREILLYAAVLADIPAIALTAFPRVEDRERALEAGFNFHITKPVDPAPSRADREPGTSAPESGRGGEDVLKRGVNSCAVDFQQRDRHRQFESPLARVAGIDVEQYVLSFDERFPRVAAHDHQETCRCGLEIEFRRDRPERRGRGPRSRELPFSKWASPTRPCRCCPGTAVTGAIARSRASTSFDPISPACTMCETPASAVSASPRRGREYPR